ncbi:VRR-NUC domain-containing protein [Rhodovarius crocodyli]|uniref:VRR-NUC domain-containing protein n=1 Tax=Rhodovarius crocodyli TaxID=1979269 RepID=A0A437MC58_9PROT|nr:VRR-NUC domain-containing protein [Rhodovarius crocodyli]RVT95227.1 VRR-NUC domain-containing protein [Rhodovarius crocodyli]
MIETEILQNIRLALGTTPGVTLWRNNTGALQDTTGRLVRYGLCEGSADLIGLRTITVTPDMVGQQVAIFAAVEVKNERGRPTDKQVNFLQHVRTAGGLAGVARSPEQARLILGLPT